MSSSDAVTISLCTIVRNEEKFLAKCLESLDGAVDEKIIVDTGSTDRTVEIAERYGAKVYHTQWRENFSEARNFALQFATGDWILQLDGDEELDRRDVPLLREVVKSPRYHSVFVPILSELPDGNVSKFYYQRLFRRGAGKYRGIVHNQIFVEGEWTNAEIRIYHHGYNLSPEQMAAKYERSAKLLQKQIAQNPQDAFARFNLARIYRNRGEFGRAIEEGERALALRPQLGQPATYFMLLFDVAYSYLMLGKNDRSERLCIEGLREDDRNCDLLFTLAGSYLQQRRFEKAIATLRRFLRELYLFKKNPSRHLTTMNVDTWSFEYKALHNIGLCYLYSGRGDKAASFYTRLIVHYPEQLRFYTGLALCRLHQGETVAAAEVLESAIAAGFTDGFVYFKLGDIYGERGDLAAAMRYYKKAESLRYLDPHFLNNYGVALLAQKRYRDAHAKFIEAMTAFPDFEKSYLNALNAAPPSEDAEGVRSILRRCVDKTFSDPALYKKAAEAGAALREYRPAIELYEKYLRHRPDDAAAMSQLADCYAALGCVDSAKLGYKAALAIDPDYSDAEENLAGLEN